MRAHVVYCSACDREVELLVSEERLEAGGSPDLTGAICQDGERCSGSLCPLCAVPLKEIRRFLEQVEQS